MLRELVRRPVSAAIALVELPLTVRRSLEQANELMESSRRQIEQMERQTSNALDQAERMNELLTKVVKLTEPLEKAQRGGELFGGALKRAIFGAEFETPGERGFDHLGARDPAAPLEVEAFPDPEPAPRADEPDPEEPRDRPGPA